MTTPKSDRAATVTTPSDREIRIERIFDAPRDRVWRAMTEPDLVAQWWGRGNHLVVERLEVTRGGHWRFVEHVGGEGHAFGGRFREVVPPERVVQTFEWEGMPGHVAVQTLTLEDLGDGRTKVLSTSLFHSKEERDGMLHSGMEGGMNQSYAALDGVLGSLKGPGAPRPVPELKKVAFTVYPMKDVARARAFYEDTLGLKPGLAGDEGGMAWVEYDLPGGGCLAISNATGDEPSANSGGTVAFEVADLDGLMTRLREAGVTFRGEVIRGPRCRMQVILDSEGNALLLHQLDPADGS